MAELVDCPACRGFTPADAATCGHCGADIAREPPERRHWSERLPSILLVIAAGMLLKLCVIGAGG